jgi:hypothetical protein
MLAQEGLTVRAILYYLRLYPCWKTAVCPGCLHSSDQTASAKPCWQEAGTYCLVANSENPCESCHIEAIEKVSPAKKLDVDTKARQQDAQKLESDHSLKTSRRQ